MCVFIHVGVMKKVCIFLRECSYVCVSHRESKRRSLVQSHTYTYTHTQREVEKGSENEKDALLTTKH